MENSALGIAFGSVPTDIKKQVEEFKELAEMLSNMDIPLDEIFEHLSKGKEDTTAKDMEREIRTGIATYLKTTALWLEAGAEIFKKEMEEK